MRCGRDQVYLSTKHEISKLIFDEELHSVILLSLGSKLGIEDFAISQKYLYNFLVILSKDSAYFFHLTDLKLPPQEYELKEKAEGGKLGWGRDYN